MAAFFIATSKIKDAEKYQEYAGKAGPTFANYGGKLVTKGKVENTLVGTSKHQVVAVVSFTDMEALNSWYHSKEYQALISLRDAGADMTLVAYSEPV